MRSIWKAVAGSARGGAGAAVPAYRQGQLSADRLLVDVLSEKG